MRTVHWAAGLVLALLVGGLALGALGDDDHHGREGHREEYREGREHDGHGREGKHGRAVAMDPAYLEACGECHFAYPAGLLPEGSWRKLLAGLDDHFGNPLDLEPAARQAAAAYLEAGAGAYGELLRGLGSDLPLRITELPGFRHEHRKLAADVATSPSIGSLANCPACHRTAESGDFDDDNVSIPRQ